MLIALYVCVCVLGWATDMGHIPCSTVVQCVCVCVCVCMRSRTRVCMCVFALCCKQGPVLSYIYKHAVFNHVTSM